MGGWGISTNDVSMKVVVGHQLPDIGENRVLSRADPELGRPSRTLASVEALLLFTISAFIIYSLFLAWLFSPPLYKENKLGGHYYIS